MDMNIGQNIKARRKAKGWTLTELEKITGINNGNLSKIERNQQSLTNETMQTLATAFNVSLRDFFSAPDAEECSQSQLNCDKVHIHSRPLVSFTRLEDIEPGEIVLIDGIAALHSTNSAVGWERNTQVSYGFSAESFRHLDSAPVDLVALVVSDDTMVPRLFESDVVVVDTGDKAIPGTGGVFALVSDKRPIELRRIFPRPGGGMTVVCDNDRYPSINLTAEEAKHITIIGRVKLMRSTAGF